VSGLVIKCQATGREFSTGVQTNWDGFARMDNQTYKARCPYCKADHFWRPNDARVVEVLPADWIENQK
jgi:hypothetical protein